MRIPAFAVIGPVVGLAIASPADAQQAPRTDTNVVFVRAAADSARSGDIVLAMPASGGYEINHMPDLAYVEATARQAHVRIIRNSVPR